MANQTVSATAAGTFALGGDLTVNRLGFGAMRITGDGIWGAPKDKAGALAVLRRAVELDVNLIDTADSYGPDVSEELIAEALYPYAPGLVVATKGGHERSGPNVWIPNGRPDHLRSALEGSLRKLKLDCSISISCTASIRRFRFSNRSERSPTCSVKGRSATSASRTSTSKRL